MLGEMNDHFISNATACGKGGNWQNFARIKNSAVGERYLERLPSLRS
jgi:hypothetical protein